MHPIEQHVAQSRREFLTTTASGLGLLALGSTLTEDGVLTPVTAQAATQRDFVYLEHSGHRGLRVGDWKIVSRTDDDDRWKLYNLAEDRNELNDLAQQMPEKVQQLADRWQEVHQQFEHQSTRQYDKP